MAKVHHLRLPLTPDQARTLSLGDIVFAGGTAVITAGLPTHQRIVGLLEEGRAPPVPLQGQAFFHMGLCADEAPDGTLTPLYVNPTTSTRFAAQMPTMIRRFGLTTVAGKGGLDQASVDAMRETGCVYLSMVGGGSSMLSAAVEAVEESAWKDLIAQFRLSRIRFEGLGPLTVGVDAHGGSLYSRLAESARRRLPDILADLLARRTGS